LECRWWYLRVEALQCIYEVGPEHHIYFAFATECTARTEYFVTGIDDLPAQLGKELERRLFDQLVCGVG
jgi:hypothetical protein